MWFATMCVELKVLVVNDLTGKLRREYFPWKYRYISERPKSFVCLINEIAGWVIILHTQEPGESFEVSRECKTETLQSLAI